MFWNNFWGGNVGVEGLHLKQNKKQRIIPNRESLKKKNSLMLANY
jgi:hypothetical protein